MLFEGLGVQFKVFKKYQDMAVVETRKAVDSLKQAATMLKNFGIQPYMSGSDPSTPLMWTYLNVCGSWESKPYVRSLLVACFHIMVEKCSTVVELGQYIETPWVISQSKMDCNNTRPQYVKLYCSQGTQTQPESKYKEAESSESDFGPIKIGRPEGMSPASVMHQNQYQLSLSDEEPPQLHHNSNTGLGNQKTNTLNMVHRKVTLHTFFRQPA